MDNIGINIAMFGAMFALVGATENLIPMPLPAKSLFYLAAIITLYYFGVTHKTVYYTLMIITALIVVVLIVASIYGLMVGFSQGWSL